MVSIPVYSRFEGQNSDNVLDVLEIIYPVSGVTSDRDVQLVAYIGGNTPDARAIQGKQSLDADRDTVADGVTSETQPYEFASRSVVGTSSYYPHRAEYENGWKSHVTSPDGWTTAAPQLEKPNTRISVALSSDGREVKE